MDLIERLQDFEQSCSQLFKQVDERISCLNFAVDNMRERLLNVREQIANLTSDRNRVTRLYSPSSYPLCNGIELKIEPIDFIITTQLLDKVNGNTLPIAKMKPNGSISDPFQGIRSISSLLVYHTYENRLIQTDLLNRKVKFKTSDSSLHDYASRSYRPIKANSSIFHDKNVANKSSSGGESEQNLGPVPESILKYHQESFIEPDILDNVNILNYRDDDSNPLTGDLPDVLPSLSGIVKDQGAAVVACDQNESSQKNGFLDQFKHLFYPIDYLPLPEPSLNSADESYSSQQEQHCIE